MLIVAFELLAHIFQESIVRLHFFFEMLEVMLKLRLLMFHELVVEVYLLLILDVLCLLLQDIVSALIWYQVMLRKRFSSLRWSKTDSSSIIRYLRGLLLSGWRLRSLGTLILIRECRLIICQLR